MSVIKKPLLYAGSAGEKHMYTLFDSGANLSCINPEYIDGIAEPQSLGRTRRILTASDSHSIEVTERVIGLLYR